MSLYRGFAESIRLFLMLKLLQALILIGLGFGLSGCMTVSITNLTPSDFPRSNSGLYRVEAAWDHNQKSVVEDSVEPVVIVGTTQYPMQPVPFAQDRWETMIPVSGDQDTIYYQFKFNYLYQSVPHAVSNSKRSEEFRLDITPRE